jgi:SAM-dependent methyltransferase
VTETTADYAALALVYDEWQERYGAFWRVVLPRLEATLARAPQDAPSFLDLGCGTGTLLAALRTRHLGWRLAGVDASAAMLDVARRRPAAGVGWVRARFDRALPFRDGSFAAAGSFFDAINHAAEPGALASVCAAAARALRPGGLFVFDLNNQIGFDAWWRGRRVYATATWTLTMDATFDPGARLAHGRATVQLDRADAPRTSAVIERCFSDDEIHAALAGAGFAIEMIEPWTPMPDDVPGKTWIVARRS